MAKTETILTTEVACFKTKKALLIWWAVTIPHPLITKLLPFANGIICTSLTNTFAEILNKMPQFYTRLWLLLGCIVFSTAVFAGIVKGKVTDSKTGEPLVGATVVLEGGKKKITTNVNLDGSYTFKNVRVGSYHLKVIFTGYKTVAIADVRIKTPNDVVVIGQSLEEATSELDEVQVTTNGNKESDNSARRIEKNNDALENVMSAKTIELSPDVTVANSLQRMSGVSFQSSSSGEGKYAIIRGMDQRYNTTLINGIPIPSPDDRFRYVPMNLFPSDILQRLEVVKALTPNMEGNAIGGVMNLVMKDAPNKEEFRVFAAGGGNTLFNDRPYASFPHGGINKKSPYELTNGGNATDSSFTTNNLKLTPRKQPFNLQTGLTFGNRYFHKKLGFVLSLSYQSFFRGTDQTLITQYPGSRIIGNAYGVSGATINNYPVLDQVFKNTISTGQKRFALNNKFDYIINNRNKISLYNLFVHLDEFQTRVQGDTDVNATPGAVSYSTRTGWRIQSIYNTTLHGEHKLANRVMLDWSATYSLAKQQQPDLASYGYDASYQKPGFPIQYYPADSGKPASLKHTWSHNKDQDVAGYINLTLKRNIAHRDVEFGFGGMFREKTRENFYRTYSLSVSGNSAQIITDLDSFHYQFNPTNSNPASGTTGTARNFSITEDVAAAYAQFKFMATTNLQILGGVRFENTDQHYTTDLIPILTTKYGHIYYYDFLPSLHLKYSLNSRQSIRASYFRSFIRPSFAEILPSLIPASETEAYAQQGNPYLKHTTADNYDIRFEIYPKKGAGQLLIGAFVKKIYNPIEVTFSHSNITGNTSSPGTNILTPTNVGNVTNAGLEFLIVHYLGKFGISANYTYTHSATTTSKNYFTIDALSGSRTDSVNQTRPLQGQAQHIGNVSLLFKDNNKLGLDMQLAYVYTGERIQLVNSYYNLDTWQSPFGQLDFSFTKKIVKKVEVYGKIINLTNEHTRYFIKNPYYNSAKNTNALPFQDKPGKEIFVQQDIFKTSYLLGVRYRL
ncbi:TonB-dependent receptor domain-containing protein [Parasediminibacterium sp. JCM 36343]|uniref:TonB-dependent receptor n=1 Tax=Parasediminibacterium sp. JCM 36343 TaxID=3374279 RepID=UPI00397A8368